MEEGKLLYAIILSEEEGSSLHPSSLAPLHKITGLDDAPLEIVPYRDLAAVVSSIDLERFGQGPSGASDSGLVLQGEERLQVDLVRYQQVNLSLLEDYTVVPMRFGFTARDREHVEEVLEKTYLQLRTFLNRFKGKVELVVQTFWDLPKILQEIAAQDGGIVQAKREAARERGSTGSPRTVAEPGHPELVEGRTISGQRPVEVGRILFEAAEARKKELTTVIHAHLSPWAIDSSEGPLKTLTNSLPLEGGGLGWGCAEHIFNRSYLVEREKEPLFDAAMDRLGAGYDGCLTFRYIGPLPAYSFANLELTQGNFEVIDQARKTLGLPEKALLEEIKAAYRRLALTSHPDRHPEDPRAEERFKAIAHAYEVLEAYCHSVQDSSGGTEHSFARENVERVFIVKDKGACHI